MVFSSITWLMIGLGCIALEAVGITGIGLFFLGLGALLVGVLMEFGVIGAEQLLLQLATLFLATAAFAYLLWRPLKRLKLGFGKVDSTYVNMIGDTAIVSGSGLTTGAVGDVIWSGTIMKAELVKSAGDMTVTAGSQVEIVEVKGATLIVTPK